MICFAAHSVRFRIAKAKRKAPRRRVTSTYRRQEALTRRMGNAVQIDLVKGIKTFRKKVSSEELAEAFRKGNYAGIDATIPWDGLHEEFDPAVQKIYASAHSAAKDQIEILPPNINKNLRFDMSQPRLKNYLKNTTANLVKYVQDDTRKIIRDQVTRAFNQALSPRDVAEQIKSSIGLLPQHEKAVASYEKGLIDAGRSNRDVERLTDDYRDRLLDYRAMNIARTEVKGAVNQGALAVWREGANQGLFDKATTKKAWVVDGDPCPICEPMDGVEVGIDESWTIELLNGQTRVVDVPSESHPQCFCGMELIFANPEDEKESAEENEE